MAFAVLTGGASGASKTSGNTIATGTWATANAPAGSLVIVAVAKDNVSTVDGQTSEVTSVTDTKGNTYTKIREFCNGQGAAAAGAVISVWYSILTAALVVSTDTITANLSAAVTARSIGAGNFSIAAGSTIGVSGAMDEPNDAAAPAAMTISGLTSKEYLFIWETAQEQTSPVNGSIANYAFFGIVSGTSGGGAASNIAGKAQYRILTGTGDTTTPSGFSAVDGASVYFGLYEIAGGPATYNVGTDESGTAADSETGQADFTSASSETGSAAASQTGLVDFAVSEAETLAASDSSDATIGGAPQTYNVATTESVSAADAETAQADFLGARAESGSATDVEASQADFVSTRSEAGTAADSETASALFQVARAEALAASDSEAALATFSAGVTESGVAADSETGNALFPVARAESLAASDSEDATTSSGPQIFNVAVNEALSSADSLQGAGTFAVARTESLAASESESVSALFAGAASESLAAAEGESVAAQFRAAIDELLASLDSETADLSPRTLPLAIARSDATVPLSVSAAATTPLAWQNALTTPLDPSE